jgi:hypothetical protein
VETVIYLQTQTVVICLLRHIGILDKRISILDRFLETIPGDPDFTDMRSSHIARKDRLVETVYGISSAARDASHMFDIMAHEVPVALSRDDFLDYCAPTVAVGVWS